MDVNSGDRQVGIIRNPGRVPLLIAGVGFFGTLALGVYAWQTTFPEVQVVVARADLPAGTRLTEDMLERRTVAAAAQPASAVTWEQAVDKWAAIPVLAGEPLTWRRLRSEPPKPKEVHTGGTLTIPVRSTYALHLRPNDRITIAVGAPAPAPAAEGDQLPEADPELVPPGTVLLRDIRILDILNSAGTPTQGQPAQSPNALTPPGGTGPLPAALVLEVTEDQALTLVGALESNTTLYFYRPPGGGTA